MADALRAHQARADGEQIAVEIVVFEQARNLAAALNRKGVDVGKREAGVGTPVDHAAAATAAQRAKRPLGAHIDRTQQRMILKVLVHARRGNFCRQAETLEILGVADARERQQPRRVDGAQRPHDFGFRPRLAHDAVDEVTHSATAAVLDHKLHRERACQDSQPTGVPDRLQITLRRTAAAPAGHVEVGERGAFVAGSVGVGDFRHADLDGSLDQRARPDAGPRCARCAAGRRRRETSRRRPPNPRPGGSMADSPRTTSL
jgi:hypothetical protein